jgi:L-ascorbate metabolism protein UlaG (beta-lactamase superfamily)
MEIKYHGHSCFSLIEGETKVVLDPFLKPNNPVAIESVDDVEATHVFLTHGHVDHSADAVALAKKGGAQVVAIVELAKWLEEQGVENVSDPNLGGTVTFDEDECWVKLVQAWHTNTVPGNPESPFSATAGGTSLGSAAGLVVNLDNKSVYHCGDTALFSDMKLIAERTPVDVALIPIGGHYTMDREDAVVAAKLIGAETVIPIHFNTFPPIETEPDIFKADVESQTNSKVVILEPGESTHV